MTQKLTYEELKQRVQELEEEAAERKRAQEALRESGERYRMLVERSNDGIVIIQDAVIKYANPSLAKMLGYDTNEAIGTPFTNYVYPDEVDEAIEDYRRRMAGEDISSRYERGLWHRNGGRIATEISGVLITYQGEPADLVVIRDITERKRAEQAILNSKAMLQSVFDGITDPLIMVDKDLTVRMVNKQGARYYGVGFQDMIGKSCHEAFQDRQETCEGCEIPSAVLDGRPVTFERKGLMDPHRLEQVITYPLKDTAGSVEGAIIQISDITEARFMERQLILSEKLATLGLLVSSIAHEINNPLAVINEESGLMKDLLGAVDNTFEYRGKFLKLLDSIFNSVKRARTIIHRLLGFGKRQDVKTEPIQINQLLEDVLGFLERDAFHRSIDVSLDFSPDLPELESDKGQLQQVFLNIIKNAFEAIESRGKISITTRWLKDPDSLHIIITDDGPGMPPDQVEHIFEPFHITTKESGTGLGLYITHHIVTKELRGQIMVKSELGRGTTFTVKIPRKKKEATN